MLLKILLTGSADFCQRWRVTSASTEDRNLQRTPLLICHTIMRIKMMRSPSVSLGETGIDVQGGEGSRVSDLLLPAVSRAGVSLGAPQGLPRQHRPRDHLRVHRDGEPSHQTRHIPVHPQHILMCHTERQAQAAGPEKRKRREQRKRQVERLKSLITMTGAAGDGMRELKTDPPVQLVLKRSVKVLRKIKNVSCGRTSSTIQRRRGHAGFALRATI